MDDRGLEAIEAASGMRDDNINISDVIEVIETDPDFNQSSDTTIMLNGDDMQLPSQQQQQHRGTGPKPSVKIIEQPASKALRFRYECEGRSAGSIPGVSSTPENKTFPAIQIVGYKGRAVVVVSCVTKDPPYRPHPHNLVGREGCKKGVCTMEVSPETMSVTFSNLGIQCVKKKDIESALKVREEIRVDPFRTGFSHRNQPTSIDLNAVRLCFQVFLQAERGGKFTVPLPPIVSEPIYDKKAMCDLVIVKLSDCVVPVNGGTKDIILLCEKVAKEDIQVRFYEVQDGMEVWQAFGEFQPSQVHKQTAIWFRAPKYRTLDITEPVKVFIQLRRPSDGATSESLPFEYTPLDSDSQLLKHKRAKFERNPNILQHLPELERIRMRQQSPFLNIPMEIKTEPKDPSPNPYSPYGGYYPPIEQLGPSPPPREVQYQQLPGTSTVMNSNLNTLPAMETWNIPSQLPNNLEPVNMNIDSIGSGSFFDLDSKQLKILDSGDLNFLDATNLSENLSANLSLVDKIACTEQRIEGAGRQENTNMTDSLTKLANSTLDSIYQLNDMCKPSNN